jgi:hypothetical protein
MKSFSYTHRTKKGFLHCVFWDACLGYGAEWSFSNIHCTKKVVLHYVLWDASLGWSDERTFSYTLRKKRVVLHYVHWYDFLDHKEYWKFNCIHYMNKAVHDLWIVVLQYAYVWTMWHTFHKVSFFICYFHLYALINYSYERTIAYKYRTNKGPLRWVTLIILHSVHQEVPQH